MNTFSADTSFPPSLAHQPLAAMFVTMGVWLAMLLAAQWIFSIISDMIEHPRPRNHPLTATRWVKLFLLAAALSQIVPRLVLLMAWKTMSAEARIAWAVGSWVIYVPAAVMFAFAWWIDRQVRATETVQMSRPPCPHVAEKTKITPDQKKRSVVIAGLIFVIAFATTYVRPAASDGPAPIVQRR